MKKTSHKRTIPNSKPKINAPSSSSAGAGKSKYQTTDTAEDQEKIIVNEPEPIPDHKISNSKPTFVNSAATHQNLADLENNLSAVINTAKSTLQKCYEQVYELELAGNKFLLDGKTKTAQKYLEKAKEIRVQIEQLTKEVLNEQKLLKSYQHQKSEKDKSSIFGNEKVMKTLIDTNFSDPSPEIIMNAQSKGLDLTKNRFLNDSFFLPLHSFYFPILVPKF
jgi:hypothetical protein